MRREQGGARRRISKRGGYGYGGGWMLGYRGEWNEDREDDLTMAGGPLSPDQFGGEGGDGGGDGGGGGE
jgi:hypothetical protein